MPKTGLKSHGCRALHLRGPSTLHPEQTKVHFVLLSPERSLLSSRRALGYFSGISEQMLPASYGHIWSFALSPDPAKDPALLLTTKNCFYLL